MGEKNCQIEKNWGPKKGRVAGFNANIESVEVKSSLRIRTGCGLDA